MKIIHTCDYPTQDITFDKLNPGELYVCQCHFLFLHGSNCGGNKQKESFATESKQQGRMKLVNRIQEYTCHYCKFKCLFSGLKKDSMYFTKLTRIDLTSAENKCPFVKKCDEISQYKYEIERTPFQNMQASTIIRSLEEYTSVRRTYIDKCGDGCCKMFHECISKAEEQANEAEGH